MWARMPPPPPSTPFPFLPLSSLLPESIKWFIEDHPSPVSKLSLFLSLPMCRPSSLLKRGGGGGEGAESYDGEKALSSINHSILPFCIPKYWIPASLTFSVPASMHVNSSKRICFVQCSQYLQTFLILWLKGSLTRDFRSQFFFMNQCPPGPQVFHWGHFEFFRKFAEIFAN